MQPWKASAPVFIPEPLFLPLHNLNDLKLQSGEKLQLLFIKLKVPKCVSSEQTGSIFLAHKANFFAFHVKQSK